MKKDFVGSKIALLCGDKVVTILRDNKKGLVFANMWDLPGGLREGSETALECALRETKEELSLDVNPDCIIWEKEWPGMTDPKTTAFFYVASISPAEVEKIELGNEGQRWELVGIQEFLNNPEAIAACKERLRDFIDRTKN